MQATSEMPPIARWGEESSALAPMDMAWAFPEVDPGVEVLGARVLVQLRRMHKKVTESGIHLVKETKEAEKWNNMVGKVVQVGPLAYLNRDTLHAWPEGTWIKRGDFVRVPRYGGDRWERGVPGEADTEEPVLFVVVNDFEVISRVTADPLSFTAFLRS